MHFSDVYLNIIISKHIEAKVQTNFAFCFVVITYSILVYYIRIMILDRQIAYS